MNMILWTGRAPHPWVIKNSWLFTTDVETGEALYTEAQSKILDDLLKGSSSVPVMYRELY
jgi:hypothetical protein